MHKGSQKTVSTSHSRRGLQRRARLLQQWCETLEKRTLLTGSWANLSASGSGPANGQMMMLLSDGSVLVQGGANQATSTIYRLSPKANTGSYVNGVWSDAGDMNEGRLFFTTAMLPDGRIFAVGGEYGKFSNTAEIYNPLTDSWSLVDPVPTPNTNVFRSGKVTGATNTAPITITTSSRTSGLNVGDSVTLSGIGGNTAANGTFTISNITGNTFVLNGSAGNGAYTTGGTWSAPSVPQFGDDPIEVLPDGSVLAGYFNDTRTFRFIPGNAPGSQWVAAGSKLHGDRSDEEAWVKLPDNSILTYDIFGSGPGTSAFKAQRYVPSTDTWVDASNVDGSNPPSILETNGAQGAEMGPAFLQPDGNVIYFGANGNTAIYNPTTNLWSAGPAEPQKNLTITPDSNGNYNVTNGGSPTFLVGTDDPGVMLPNGHILIALSPLGPLTPSGGYSFPNASYIYEYDPVAQTFTENTPSLSAENAYRLNMVQLPNGQVLLADEGGGFQVYTPDPAVPIDNSWRPSIAKIFDNGDSTFTMTGTQLNGISEGANYGDDNQSASNYPIIQFTDGGGNISYARTFNWSSTGVATGSTIVSTKFTLPAGHSSLSDFSSLVVIANGIPSFSVAARANPNVTAPADQTAVEGTSKSLNLGSFIDPDGSSWSVDVDWGDGTSHTVFNSSPGSLGTQSHNFGEEGSYTVTVTVTDNTSLAGSATFKVSVSDPAVIASAVALNAVEGEAFTGKTVATFTDPGGAEPNSFDPGSISDHYTATIDWGDGTATSAGTITYSAGVFTVKGDHTYAEESAADHPGSNPYAVTVTIHHESAPDAVANSTATVSDPAVIATGGFTFVAVEGEPSAIQTVATFTDPGGAEALSDYSAMIDWGDGTAPSAGTISYSAGVFTVTGSHTFATGLGEPGDFGNTFCSSDAPSYHKAITVTISHEDAPTSQAVSDAKISLKPGTAHLTNNGALIVVGTSADDKILINPVGNQARKVNVYLGDVSLGTFTVAAAQRIVVAAMGGNDDVQLAGAVRVDSVLYGAPGDDRLKGGAGSNILVGCEGDDTLNAGNLGDLMVGGAGSDRLVGGNGDDILIGGLLVDAANAEDDQYTDLVTVLNTGYVPLPLHVADDGVLDRLTGGAGFDTSYYNFQGGGVWDILTDKPENSFDI